MYSIPLTIGWGYAWICLLWLLLLLIVISIPTVDLLYSTLFYPDRDAAQGLRSLLGKQLKYLLH